MKIAMRDRWGGPEVLELREVPIPEPVGDQVRVRIHASSVNRADLDWMLPKGGWAARLIMGLRAPRTKTSGIDLAGTVDAVGPEARRFHVGDRVFGDVIGFGMGAFAEYKCVPERALARVPERLSFEEAATLPHSGLLGVMGLKPYFGQTLEAGDSIMVVGASGNVGPFVVQIAKHRGMRVTGVCRTSKVDFVRSLGADDVIDYTTTDYTKSGPFDRIIDVDAHRSIFGFAKALRKGGVYISMGGNGIWILSYVASAFIRLVLRDGKHMNLMPSWRAFRADDVAVMKELVEAGAIVPAIDRRYPLSEIRAALADVHEGRSRGKIVVTVVPD